MTDNFICPTCKQSLTLENKTLKCENNHCYDLAKQGYVNLLMANQMHSKNPGDTKEMVDSRRRFLGKKHYDIFAQTICELVKKYAQKASFILDCGCGEGYYTNNYSNVTDADIVGFDISKSAVKAAAGSYKHINFAVASCFNIPIKSDVCDLLVNIFSPMAVEEFSRVLKKDGVFIYAIPGKKHLYELKEILYENPYENEEKDSFYDGFELLERVTVKGEAKLSTVQEVWDLFSMTPYYWKTDVAGSAKLKLVDRLDTQIHFDFLVYKKV